MNAYRTIHAVLTAAVIAIVLLPLPAAAEVRIAGHVMAGLGQYSVDDGVDTTSRLRGESQGEVNFLGSNGAVSYRYRLRVRESTRDSSTTTTTYAVVDSVGVPTGDTVDVSDTTTEGFAAVRHQVSWKVSDALTLDFWGQSFGLPAAGTAYGVYSIGHFGDGIVIGDAVPTTVGRFSNATGVNVDFNLGAMSVGATILDHCKPDCGTATEKMTIVPHFRGKFGDISVSAFMSNASGTDAADAAVDASETNLEVAFKTSAIQVGFEYVMYSDSGDNEATGMALGLKLMGGAVGLHYVSLVAQDGAGNDISDDSEIAAAYTHTINDKSSLVIGYASASDNFADPSTGSSLIVASLKSSF